MASKSRIPRLALDFLAAGTFAYFSYLDAKNGNESLSTVYKFLSGFAFCDGLNNATKYLLGNTHFVPVLEQVKSNSRGHLKTIENEQVTETILDDSLDLNEIPLAVKNWDDDELVPG